MNCGTIFYDRTFQFEDTGKTIDKLAIVICETGDCHFVLYTTSQPSGKTAQAGCNLNDTPPSFYIPARTAFFQENTWVLLHRVTEVPNYLLEAKLAKKGTVDVYEGQFPITTFKHVLECAMQSKFIDGFHKEFIKRTLATLN